MGQVGEHWLAPVGPGGAAVAGLLEVVAVSQDGVERVQVASQGRGVAVLVELVAQPPEGTLGPVGVVDAQKAHDIVGDGVEKNGAVDVVAGHLAHLLGHQGAVLVGTVGLLGLRHAGHL